MKSYTDTEQSKKLAEILPIESADMIYNLHVNQQGQLVPEAVPFFKEVYDKGVIFTLADRKTIPCWSLATLMCMLPSEFTEKDQYSETTYKIDIRKHALTDDVDVYQIAYGNVSYQYEDEEYAWSDMINSGEKEELIDVCVDMIIWLKENKKL